MLFNSYVIFTREDGTSTFLFRPSVLVKEVERVECILESDALSNFFTFLKSAGPNNIVLVGLDEDTVGWCFFFCSWLTLDIWEMVLKYDFLK